MTQSHEPATLIVLGPSDSISTPNSTVVSVYHELQISLFCDFKFREFPMDTQSCQFLGTNEHDRELQLLPPSENKTNKFPVMETDGFEINTLFLYGNDFGSEKLSYCGFNLTMRRILQPYLFQYYLPGAAIVCISQISFIIPPSSIPGRIGLLATLFLTLMNIFINHMVSIEKHIM